jgi:tetratricopeptide (TPR) repeat protein
MIQPDWGDVEMKFGVGSPKVVFSLLALAVAAAFQAQIGAAGVNKSQAPAYVAPPGNEDLIVQVRRADGDALPGTARIRLTTRQAAAAEVVAEPTQSHRARFSKVPLGPVRLQIVADGFATSDLKVLLEHSDREMRVTIYLRPETRGGPNGEGWIPALSATASSHYAKIVDSLRKGDLKESQQHYGKLRRGALGHPNVQYVAGVVDYRSKDTGMALFHFSQAAYLNPEYEDSARALGGLLYRTGIYGEAYEVFSRLARKHPQEWEPAWQAASAAFLAAQYPEARENAQAAFEHGGAAALKAEALLAFTDAMLKKWPEARAAATTVVTQSKDPGLAATAQDLLVAVGPGDAASDSNRHALAPQRAEAALLSTEDYDPRVPPRLWAPPDVDDSIPTIIQGTPCNAAEVLKLAGLRVAARFEKLSEVAATENIEQAVLDATGRVMPLKHFTVDYLAEAHLMPNGNYAVDEFLTGNTPEPSPTSPPVAHGLAALALVFHPNMQSDFTFDCEGLTPWKGRPAWSIHFTERKDLPARLHAYNASGTFYPAYIRGRGFVDQALGELLHMETDLEDSIPQLRLEEEHLVVDYAPVTFRSVAEPFYLPSEAELYVHFRGHLYRIREDFKKYLRFDVATRQDIKAPKEKEKPPEP